MPFYAFCIMFILHLTNYFPAPHEFTTIPFPVKALKIVLHDIQSGGDAATLTAQGDVYDVDSDDDVNYNAFLSVKFTDNYVGRRVGRGRQWGSGPQEG